MTGILGQLKWVSLTQSRKDNRLLLLYKRLKGKASIPTDDLIPKTRCVRNQHSMAFQTPAVKNHVIRYCEKVYERSGKNLFWSIKNSGEVLNKLKSRGFRATSLSTYDFSTLYTTLPHNLIKEKLINLIEWTFKREGSSYIACNERQAFFTSEDTKRYKLWSC